MTGMIADHLINESMALSISERLELACRLLDSVEESETAGAGCLDGAEIKRRAEEVRSGQTPTIPAEDVFRRLRTMTSGQK